MHKLQGKNVWVFQVTDHKSSVVVCRNDPSCDRVPTCPVFADLVTYYDKFYITAVSRLYNLQFAINFLVCME